MKHIIYNFIASVRLLPLIDNCIKTWMFAIVCQWTLLFIDYWYTICRLLPILMSCPSC